MGMFLNSRSPLEEYKTLARTRFFVDKSELIDELLTVVVEGGQRYICITRPRRFGKSVTACMIGAFFGRPEGAGEVFDGLRIAESDRYQEHLGRQEVIYIDFSRLPENCNSYDAYIRRISDGMKEDLNQAYPERDIDVEKPVWDNLKTILEQEDKKVIFVMDEWDAIFHKDYITERDKKRYALRFQGKIAEESKVEGRILLVGIGYDRKTKEHICKVEEL